MSACPQYIKARPWSGALATAESSILFLRLIQQTYQYCAVVIGTYTWGNGEIPKEMWRLYLAFEELNNKDITTAVVGTGDSFYPKYCGAVDLFRDMLMFIQTWLQP